jgi:hypothetical protein
MAKRFTSSPERFGLIVAPAFTELSRPLYYPCDLAIMIATNYRFHPWRIEQPVARAYVGTYSDFEREQFLIDQMPEVRAIARSLTELLEKHVNDEELLQAGALGLIDALHGFNPLARKEEFASFAKSHILAAMIQCLQAESTESIHNA